MKWRLASLVLVISAVAVGRWLYARSEMTEAVSLIKIGPEADYAHMIFSDGEIEFEPLDRSIDRHCSLLLSAAVLGPAVEELYRTGNALVRRQRHPHRWLRKALQIERSGDKGLVRIRLRTNATPQETIVVLDTVIDRWLELVRSQSQADVNRVRKSFEEQIEANRSMVDNMTEELTLLRRHYESEQPQLLESIAGQVEFRQQSLRFRQQRQHDWENAVERLEMMTAMGFHVQLVQRAWVPE